MCKSVKTIRPTNIVWIVHNKGYKKCKKSANVTNTSKDIIDANIEIFKHANSQVYSGSILVLEDDFLFDSKIADPSITGELTKFIREYSQTRPLIYYLGILPVLQFPIDWSHNMVVSSCGTHAVIYNKIARNEILKQPVDQMYDWDIYLTSFVGSQYTYKTPLVYQLFPNTDNSSIWGYQSMALRWIGSWFHYLNIAMFHLDKQIEPGYGFYYSASKIVFFIIVFLFLYVVFYVVYKLWRILIPRRIVKKRNHANHLI